MPEVLFDLSDEYERMLNRGIRLSGESREFFVKGRIDSLRQRLPTGFRPRRILDYGSGTGGTAAQLAEAFSADEVVGVDTSRNAVAHATETHGSPRVRFRSVDELPGERDFDLCYVNGVFHHIESERRPTALAGIRRALRPAGCLALFENNPWNPAARLVMTRIPFDREARTFSPVAARRMLTQAQFTVAQSWSLFYFPRPLMFLRPLEGVLAMLPFGAQYCVLSIR